MKRMASTVILRESAEGADRGIRQPHVILRESAADADQRIPQIFSVETRSRQILRSKRSESVAQNDEGLGGGVA